MTALLIIVAAIICLVIGYVAYGSWLAKQWGVDPKRSTPAHTRNDGIDYVAAPPAVLMGHHFSSIAGAGPINGPIQAAVFGWLPVFLWCVIGGIFIGGLQDFGSLFASIRNDGKSVGEIIRSTMGRRSRRLFILFSLMVSLLAIASFVNVVAGTFMTEPNEAGVTPFGFVFDPSGNQTTAFVSILFIVLAIVYGIMTNRYGIRTNIATIIGIIGIVAIILLGMNVGFAMNRMTWILCIGVYITLASLIPVWILLQPRDYLSSFLLYATMIIALGGIIFSAFAGTTDFQLPVFGGWKTDVGVLFPTLFITVACGACSGFHSLVATGTSSKQLDSEAHAKAIGYGSMLIESALGIISMIAVGMVFAKFKAGGFGSPSAAFAGGIATMFAEEQSPVYDTIYAMLTLAASVFALTSLDTATRLSRFLFTELFLKEGEHTWRDATGIRRILAHPLAGTLTMVLAGCTMGALELREIWSMFGTANQMLASIALMAVCSWLGDIGKNNRMFYFPMGFMLAATVSSLLITIKDRIGTIIIGNAMWGDFFGLFLAVAMIIVAIILVKDGNLSFRRKAKRNRSAA